jgi:hypothetical protein
VVKRSSLVIVRRAGELEIGLEQLANGVGIAFASGIEDGL